MEDKFLELVRKIQTQDSVPYSVALKRAAIECGRNPLDKKAHEIAREESVSYSEGLRAAVIRDPSLEPYLKQ